MRVDEDKPGSAFAKLIPHPHFPALAVRQIEAATERRGRNRLLLTYRVAGRVSDLLFPSPADPVRTDGLWRHSCFELFARASGDGGYLEYNFAPSAQWAAYRFDGYRTGMRDAETMLPRVESWIENDDVFSLQAEVDLPSASPWELGLSAIIEEIDGRRSYWALRHPPGEPDFHHSDCFALQLAPAA
jgi:hypothetical protein